MASSNLYPPIVAYSMPAFAVDEQGTSAVTGQSSDNTVRVYFALSSYNRRSDFNTAHVTVRYQQNNANALSTEKYPAQIKICAVNSVTPEEDPVIAATAARFYIELSDSDLEKATTQSKPGFIPDVTYKVQIRLSTDTVTNPQKLSYFSSHLNYFSEWSTVCCIRGVLRPDFYVVGLENTSSAFDDEEVELIVASVDSDFIISYTPGSKEETLSQWRVQLLNADQSQVLSDSEWTTFDSYNNVILEDNGSVQFEVILPYQMSNENNYNLAISILTKNNYQETKIVPFNVTINSDDRLAATIKAEVIEEEGYAEIKIKGLENTFTGNLVLRRSSSRSNFTVWEDIAHETIKLQAIDWTYCDFTIESGVWYQYGVQTKDAYGRRGLIIITPAVMGEFEDAFLVEASESLSNAKQLKLRYDFKISNFVRTIAESKTDTIGSQFPFVRRNGNMYYRELQCTGLITAYMDANARLFISDTDLYDHNQDRYQAIRDQIEVFVNDYDYTYEREFRKAVEEFLYNGKVKLFKSLQEGNILVKVMNVTLTPKQELGRLIYDFSATLVEVDEPTIPNLNKYGIITVGTYNPNITLEADPQIARLGGEPTTYPANVDINNFIKDAYNFNKIIDDNKVVGYTLNYLRLEMESDPYLIHSRTMTTVDDIDDEDSREQITTEDDIDDIVLGWGFKIGTANIIIEPPNNIYELKGDGVFLTENTPIIPLADTEMAIDMVITTSSQKDSTHTAYKKIYTKINGQYINTFEPSEDVVKTLWYKYYVDYYDEEASGTTNETYYTQIITVINLDVEAEPGTILKARSSGVESSESGTNLTTFIIGETGRLLLDPGSEEYTIEEMYVAGTRVDARYLINKYNTRSVPEALNQASNPTLEEWNLSHNKGAAAPEVPRQYDYYTSADGAKMYYNGKWYPVDIIQIEGVNTLFDISCPVDAMIFYFLQAVKGIY